jgi:hypothetical protein
MQIDGLPDAGDAGRTCARAFLVQQAIKPWLLDNDWIERGYVGPVTAAYAFAYPWLSVSQLALCVQFELWIFGADKLIDTDATSRADVVDLVARWIRVGQGEVPAVDDPPGLALTDLRRRFAESCLWPTLGERWERLFRRTFEGMIEEWDGAVALMSGRPTPTIAEYLANSDSCGFRLIRLTDWIVSADPSVGHHIRLLTAAAWHAEVSSRLTNDLHTHERERDQIDLNVIKLGYDVDDVVSLIDQETRTVDKVIAPLIDHSIGPAIALQRILRFGNGFYELSDFRPPPEHLRPSVST